VLSDAFSPENAKVFNGRMPLVDAFSSREPASISLENAVAYSLAICVDAEWKIPAPETCDAIRNATTTAGTLISLKNWSTESIVIPPKRR
jgi:hypothetical protein